MQTNTKDYHKNKYKRDKTSGMLIEKKKYMKGQARKENAIGYCHNNIHRGYLTKDLIKQHSCIKKKCKYFSKYEDHPYWVEKKRTKLSAKVSKYMAQNNLQYMIIQGHYFKVEDKQKILKLIRDFKVSSFEQIQFK